MKLKNTAKYEDIIYLEHPVSKTHPQMPRIDRAAQFSPFAALTGHDAAIKETARLTDERVELDENAKSILNEKFQLIMERLDQRPLVMITYFRPDLKKEGGSYTTISGQVKKFDEYIRAMVMTDGKTILVDDIFDIEFVDNDR